MYFPKNSAKIGLASLAAITIFNGVGMLNPQNATASFQKLPSECRSQAVVYKHDNFRGQRIKLTRTYYGDLKDYKMTDEISSVCVPKGMTVYLYEHHGFRGKRLRVQGPYSWNDLKRQRPYGQNWGDRISSIKVSR